MARIPRDNLDFSSLIVLTLCIDKNALLQANDHCQIPWYRCFDGTLSWVYVYRTCYSFGKAQSVVVLIDEYDYPILRALDTPAIAEENRNILKDFFSVLKSSNAYLRAIFHDGGN